MSEGCRVDSDHANSTPPIKIMTKMGGRRPISVAAGGQRRGDERGALAGSRGEVGRQRPRPTRRQVIGLLNFQSQNLGRRKLFRSIMLYATSTMLSTYENCACVMNAAVGDSLILSNARCLRVSQPYRMAICVAMARSPKPLATLKQT